MPSNFDELFESLVDNRTVTVEVVGPAAETLRTSLVRRWSSYKKRMDALGGLTQELAECGVGKRATIVTKDFGDGPVDVPATQFVLVTRLKRSYTILS